MAEACQQSVSGSGKKMIRRWVRVILGLAFVCGVVFFVGGRVLRKLALVQIGELADANVKVRYIDLSVRGEVLIEKLVITPQRVPYDDTILIAETVHARFGLWSFLLLRPRLKEITISNFVFNAQKDLDDLTWNIGAIRVNAADRKVSEFPFITLEKGILQYSQVRDNKPAIAASLSLDAKFGPAERAEDGYAFNIKTAEISTGYARSNLNGTWKPGRLVIAGGISSTNIPRLERCCTIDVLAGQLDYDEDNNFSLALKIKDLFLTTLQNNVATFPEPTRFIEEINAFSSVIKFFDRYHPIGRIDIEVKTLGNLTAPAGTSLSGAVECRDVSICKDSFQYPVDNLAGKIDFTERSIFFNNLSGRSGDSMLFFNGFSKGFGAEKRYDMSITSNNLELDEKLYGALDEEYKKLWRDYSPRGRVAIDYHFAHLDDTGEKSTLTVRPVGAGAVCRYFPYPLENLTGNIVFNDQNIIISDIISNVDDLKIMINGEITVHTDEEATYTIGILAENVALDSTLAAALPEKQKQLYEQFDITGLADADVKIQKTKRDMESPDFIARMDFKEADLQLDHLGARFSDVSAKAVFTTDTINIQEFYGRFANGEISLTGQIHPGGRSEKHRYELAAAGVGAELNDDLLGLLPSPLGENLGRLNPAGLVNYRANITNIRGAGGDDYEIKIDCLGNSLKFARFAYPLKDILGTVVAKSSSDKIHLEFERVSAVIGDGIDITPNASTVEIDGRIVLEDSSFYDGFFKLFARDIGFDERLGGLLSEELRGYYEALSPGGRFDLDAEQIEISDVGEGRKRVDFEGAVKLKSCSLKTSPKVSELSATFQTKGVYNTDTGLGGTQVEVAGDSVGISQKILTGLNGNIIYDPDRKTWSGRDFVADCYDGRLLGKMQVRQESEEPPGYVLEVSFDNVGMEEFLNGPDVNSSGRGAKTSGKMYGTLNLSGRLGDESKKLGRFRLLAVDMQVGKASPMAKLLDVLKLTEPKDYIFDQMLVDSYIKQDGMLFEKIDISGDNVAFNGSGKLDLESLEMDLSLTARGRRLATAEPSVLQSLTEGLGQGVVRMDVTGNLYNPEVKTKTLPVIEDTLELLGTRPDIEDR